MSTPKLFPVSRKLAAAGLRGYVRLVGGVFGLPAPVLQAVGTVIDKLDPPDTSRAMPFLSDEWMDAAREIRESYRGRNSVTPPSVRVNHIVSGVPFGAGVIEAHIDTTSGDVEFELGHLEDVDLVVSTSYDVARALIVDQDVTAAMQAFMSGDVKVEGDITKLLSLNAAPVDPLALEAASRMKAITAS